LNLIKERNQKERQLSGQQPSHNLSQYKTRDIVANFVGIGRITLKKVEEIVEPVEKELELYQIVWIRIRK
jgi:hypothetical protein